MQSIFGGILQILPVLLMIAGGVFAAGLIGLVIALIVKSQKTRRESLDIQGGIWYTESNIQNAATGKRFVFGFSESRR